MSVLGLVPARGGSKRLPGKNVKAFGGKPLVAWAIEAGLGAAMIDTLAVTSDDPKVLQIARGYEGVVAIDRPRELAGDRSPAVDYVTHALGVFEARGARFDSVAIVQPTSPLTLPDDIDGTVRLLLASGADSAASIVKLSHDVQPLKMKTLDGDRLLPYFEDEAGRMMAHQLPELYVRNGAVYAARTSLIATGRIIGEDCRGYRMPRARSVDINDELDFLFAEFLATRNV